MARYERRKNNLTRTVNECCFVECLRRYKPSELPAKRPVGRPRKQLLPEPTTSSLTPGTASQSTCRLSTPTEEQEEDCEIVNLDTDNPEQPPKKRGHYCSYSLQFKMSVVEEVCG